MNEAQRYCNFLYENKYVYQRLYYLFLTWQFIFEANIETYKLNT